MKFATGAIATVLFAAATASLPVNAATGLYATEAAAAQACAADEVVWVDLDRGRFYHKPAQAWGKSSNGGYACFKAAHAQYREGHDS